MTETERELDLALGSAHDEIAKLKAEKERLQALVAQFAQRLLEIERMANMAVYKAYAVTDESSGETD